MTLYSLILIEIGPNLLQSWFLSLPSEKTELDFINIVGKIIRYI